MNEWLCRRQCELRHCVPEEVRVRRVERHEVRAIAEAAVAVLLRVRAATIRCLWRPERVRKSPAGRRMSERASGGTYELALARAIGLDVAKLECLVVVERVLDVGLHGSRVAQQALGDAPARAVVEVEAQAREELLGLELVGVEVGRRHQLVVARSHDLGLRVVVRALRLGDRSYEREATNELEGGRARARARQGIRK